MDTKQSKLIERAVTRAKIQNPDAYEWLFDKLHEYLTDLADNPGRMPSMTLPEKEIRGMLDACCGGFISGYEAGTETSIVITDDEDDDNDVLEHAISLARMELEDHGLTLDAKTEYMTRTYGQAIAYNNNSDGEQYFAIKAFVDGICQAKSDMENGVQTALALREPYYIRLKKRHHEMIDLFVNAFVENELESDSPSVLRFIKNHKDSHNMSVEMLQDEMVSVATRYAKTVMEPLTGLNEHGLLRDDVNEIMDVVSAWLRTLELWVPNCRISMPALPNELKKPFRQACGHLKAILEASGATMRTDEIAFAVRYCDETEQVAPDQVSYSINMASAFGAASAIRYIRESKLSIDNHITKQYLCECALEEML